MRPLARTLPAALVLIAVLAAAGCTKATVAAPTEAPPIDAIEAAVEKLSEGFDYMGAYETDQWADNVDGAELPGEKKLAISRSSSDGSVTATAETIRIGNELWLRYEGIPDMPEGWGHLAASASSFVKETRTMGPSTWLPALVAQIVEAERVGTMRYEGVLDFEAVDEARTGLPEYQTRSLDDDDEVAFRAVLDVNGNIKSFRYELEGGPAGTLTVDFIFSGHGAPRDIVPPSGSMTELTFDTVTDWMFGGLDD
ncbi:hypothetical protein AB0I28_07445 [Phytomonospora sp. NPDC050363]|uniref:hypothetical protein n=1 Tax=Phytomonospora sp. NPDC050363 TaxID=3155642 RepID=UPI0033CB6B2D